jgi:hypothetical protein
MSYIRTATRGTIPVEGVTQMGEVQRTRQIEKMVGAKGGRRGE